MRSKKSQAVLARLKLATGATTDASLSLALKISPQTLSSWKGRGSTPYSLCVDFAHTHGISLDWLLLGEGPMLRPAAGDLAERSQETTLQENTILALWRLLNDDDRHAIQCALEEKRRLRDLELKLAAMSSALSALQRGNDM
ncbi:helix-turn-helix domain-containing protein [Pseudomonas sp. PB3P13]